MKFKPNIMVPVGMKKNKETGEIYFHCPKSQNTFGKLVELNIGEHLKTSLECGCLAYLSRKEDCKLILELERSKGLPGICVVGISYDKEAYCEAMERKIKKYKLDYNNGKKLEISEEMLHVKPKFGDKNKK